MGSATDAGLAGFFGGLSRGLDYYAERQLKARDEREQEEKAMRLQEEAARLRREAFKEEKGVEARMSVPKHETESNVYNPESKQYEDVTYESGTNPDSLEGYRKELRRQKSAPKVREVNVTRGGKTYLVDERDPEGTPIAVYEGQPWVGGLAGSGGGGRALAPKVRIDPADGKAYYFVPETGDYKLDTKGNKIEAGGVNSSAGALRTNLNELTRARTTVSAMDPDQVTAEMSARGMSYGEGGIGSRERDDLAGVLAAERIDTAAGGRAAPSLSTAPTLQFGGTPPPPRNAQAAPSQETARKAEKTVVERRKLKDGRTMVKYSDGSLGFE